MQRRFRWLDHSPASWVKGTWPQHLRATPLDQRTEDQRRRKKKASSQSMSRPYRALLSTITRLAKATSCRRNESRTTTRSRLAARRTCLCKRRRTTAQWSYKRAIAASKPSADFAAFQTDRWTTDATKKARTQYQNQAICVPAVVSTTKRWCRLKRSTVNDNRGNEGH